jgi:hypothetical protein
MSDEMTTSTQTTPAPESAHSGGPRLLTLTQAASATGMSRKALERRADRGTLRFVHDDQGRRVVPRAELERAGLLGEGVPAVGAGREVVKWQQLYEREREAHADTRKQLTDRADEERRRGDQAAARAEQLHADLASITNAGPIRAWRLRRVLRDRQTLDSGARPSAASAGSRS